MINILTFLGVKPGRTQHHAGAHLLVMVEAPLARRALGGSPPDAALAALVAPAAPPGTFVAEKPRGAGAHAHPGEGTESARALGPTAGHLPAVRHLPPSPRLQRSGCPPALAAIWAWLILILKI